ERARPLRSAAARRRLDGSSRFSRPAGPDLHGPLRGGAAAMSGREAILGKIRRALGRPEDDIAVRRAVAERLAHPRPNLVPARGKLPAAERVALFCRMAEQAAAAVRRLDTASDIPAAIADHLRRHNLPPAVRTGADAAIAALPWAQEPHLERRTGP